MNKKRKLDDIAICPLCGESDQILVTPKDRYDRLYKENKGACVGIECWRCHLSIHGYSVEQDNQSYEFVRATAVHKWNRLSDKIWKVEDNG